MKMKQKISFFPALLGLSLLALAVGCSRIEEPEPPKVKTVADYDASVILDWTDMFLTVDRFAVGYRGPVEARTIAYTSLAAYEAAAPGMANYQSIAKTQTGLQMPSIETGKEYHWGLTANMAYWRSMRTLFPSVVQQYVVSMDSLRDAYNKKFQAECDSAVYSRSVKFGVAVGDAITNWARMDGQEVAFRNNKPSSYRPPVGPGLWVRMPPTFLGALLPNWGTTRAISLKVADIPFKDPIPYSTNPTSEFYKQGKEVYDVSKTLTYEQRWIGEFWSDDNVNETVMPAARWNAITNQLLRERKDNLETALFAQAALGVAMFDASILCWEGKYKYNLLRPVTYIRSTMDNNWLTALFEPQYGEDGRGVTPAFPAYPSGHATFGAAAAEVMTALWGPNYKFTDRTHEKRTTFLGMPRTFRDFWHAAQENSDSRIYLGVHFRMDCDEGMRIGKIVGEKVNAMPWKKK
jgi:PAP2 superfamily